MFWLLRKLFGIGVFVALVYFALQYPFISGRPLKEYLVDFYQAPIVQEAGRQAKLAVLKYLHKKGYKDPDGPAMEDVKDEERQELEKILKKASK